MDPAAALFERFARKGDVGALGEVFDRTAPRLLHLAMHLARSAEDAEDLLQATFVLAMRKAGEFAPSQPLLPWLYRLWDAGVRVPVRRSRSRSPAGSSYDDPLTFCQCCFHLRSHSALVGSFGRVDRAGRRARGVRAGVIASGLRK